MDKSYYEIVVTSKFCHPEFGGEKTVQWRYLNLSDAVAKMNQLDEVNKNSGGMEWHFIQVVKVQYKEE